jgi:hypothetical protein
MSAPTRADWPLLALDTAEDGVLTPVQMQKALFLLEKQAHDLIPTDFYSFAAYNYGPFSSQIYDDLNEHAREGRIVFNQTPGRSWSSYLITPVGELRATMVTSEIDIDLLNYLDDLVIWVKSLRFSELVGAVYKAYPDYAKNSIFSR